MSNVIHLALPNLPSMHLGTPLEMPSRSLPSPSRCAHIQSNCCMFPAHYPTSYRLQPTVPLHLLNIHVTCQLRLACLTSPSAWLGHTLQVVLEGQVTFQDAWNKGLKITAGAVA